MRADQVDHPAADAGAGAVAGVGARLGYGRGQF
jgi:hypothetical protein